MDSSDYIEAIRNAVAAMGFDPEQVGVSHGFGRGNHRFTVEWFGTPPWSAYFHATEAEMGENNPLDMLATRAVEAVMSATTEA